AKFENGRFESQPPFGGKGFDCVSALAPARDGGLWVGARGVTKLGGTEPRPEITAAVGDGLVHALYESADGALWIALDRGLERFAEGRLAPVAGLEGEEAFALVELGPARLGIGLHGALAIVEDGVARKLDLFESVRAAVPIRDLWPAPDGALWAASYGAGLLRIGADGRVARVGSAQGLAENFVSRILPDGRGHLWLTGNRGIHRVALAELEAAVADGSARVVPLSLGVRDGLEVAETNGGGQPAGWLRGDGSLVVPTVRGVAIVEPDPPGRVPPRATVAFEEIRLSGDRVAPAGALALPARRDRRLEVHFTAPSFAQPEEVRFRYRLAGIDEEWQLDRGARTATYTHLPPGDYRFEVEALGEDETRPLSTASFALAVEPLFVETWAFRALAGAALAALVFAWHRLRLLRLRRRGVELERLVAARTREIGALNRDLERRVGEQTVEIRDTRDLAILTLARLAELRDGTTGEHLDRIARFSRRLAEALARGPFGELDEEFIDELYRSSPLHDIGKVAIPDAILCKPGPLDEREREIMKSHTTIGGDTLRAVVGHGLRRGFLDMAAEIAYSHHERWDGGGYPRGLAGTATPLVARIVAVVDAYDAITSPRPYKPSHPHEEALRRIVSDRGSHFDPQLVDAFVGIQAEIDRIRREHASAAA
ncbi:MAG TPA: HD domain-containing phosphohydrolase, partial [Thermoanaerobaculia bacterium]|nr:HD domain-containing phosphohydrolase [Thermoanaerobaculia bacterium]